MSRLVFDIETDGLLGDVSKIHCIALYDLDTKASKLFVTPAQQGAALGLMRSAKLLVGHNIKQYDLTVLKDHSGFEPEEDTEIYDTLVSGCILYPEEIRSLEDWAKILRLKQEKVQHEDWSVYSENMGKRCLADTEINAKVYEYLKKNQHEHLCANAILLEQAVASIHAQQMMNKVCFNIEKAEALRDELDRKAGILREHIIEASPSRCLLEGVPLKNQDGTKAERTKTLQAGDAVPCKAYRTKTGSVTADTRNYFSDEELQKVRGPYTKVSFRQLNPDSPQEVKALLLDLGWVPTEYNVVKEADGSWRSTSPKLTEDSYDTLPDGLGKTIAEYNTLKHRRNFLSNATDSEKGAIAEARRGDGRVSAQAFTCATNTSRYRHNGVVCNIPRVTSIYGKEMRSLFGVSSDSWMVGIDLSGIEARCLAHHILKGGYTKARQTADLILSPDKGSDFHSYNAKVWGCDRNTAKTTLYALLYGAGAKKLARTLGWPEHKGAKIKQEFFAAHPAIKELMDDLAIAFRSRGHLIGADGRPIYIRGENRLLNTLLQHTAAVLFKKWMVHVDTVRSEFMTKYKVDHIGQILAYHDELGFEVKANKETADYWGKVICQAALVVGEEFGFLVPMAAESKTGKDWSEVH